jgi:hypothetical protein
MPDSRCGLKSRVFEYVEVVREHRVTGFVVGFELEAAVSTHESPPW